MTLFARADKPHDALIYLPSMSTVIASQPGPPAGGAEVQMGLLARGLARLGARMCMVAFDCPEGLPAVVDGVNVVRRRPYQARRGPAGKLSEAAEIYMSIAAADASVVIARGASPMIALVAMSAKLQRRRFLYSSANVADFEIERMESTRRNATLFGLGIRLADRIVVQNDEQRQLCEQRFRRSPTVIKSVAEPAAPSEREPEAFLWAGRVIWYKQPLAFVQLARAVPEAKFWMVAVPEPGEDRQQLLGQLQRQARDVPNLELLRPRPRSELMALVQRSVAIVNTADFEGLSNVFLEGWTRGVPALALSHDPDRLIERFGLGAFAGGSPQRLASLTRSLWAERRDQTDVARRCRRYVRNEHSPVKVYAQWLGALDLSLNPNVTEPAMAGAY